jgi:MGT family glycosyltransferase
MSRYLISTMPAAGHVNPALPVASELVARGHEVVWHTGPDYAKAVERTGATFVPARRTPSFTDLPVEPDPGTKGVAKIVSVVRRLLVDRLEGQLADYEEIVARWPIDAVLVDVCALGGRALSERHGMPWATLGISPLTVYSPDTPGFGSGKAPPEGRIGRTKNRIGNVIGTLLLRGATKAYARKRATLGLAPLPWGENVFDHMVSPMLHLQASTPSIEYPRRRWPPAIHFVGPLLPPPSPAVDYPPFWPELVEARRPVVHVTQGTVATDPSTLTRPALQGLADLDVLVVVTSPDPRAIGSIPANTRVAPFIPHSLLLPHVQAVVTNGGFNGAKMALAHGVPQVFAPWGNDQPDVAARIAWAGAGINLHVRTPSPDAIREAVQRVLADDGYRRTALRIQREFAEYPGGERAAALLEKLAHSSGFQKRSANCAV